jgi:hypothetical protein
MVWRMLHCLVVVLSAIWIVLSPATANAEWLTRLVLTGERASAKAALQASPVERLTRAIRASAPGRSVPLLGATVSQEGHWTFVNATGEAMTASGPDEIRRIIPLLTGGFAGKPGMILADDVLLQHAERVKLLPPLSDLSVLVRNDVYPLARRSDRLLAEVRPAVLVPAVDRKAFGLTLDQLARPLARADVRILALTIDGPETLPRRPPTDGDGKPAIDAIDPYKLPAALSALSGQTAVVVGRQDGALLSFRLPSGGERTVLVDDLVGAAARHDVNLVILHATAARQPGTRNWLWQRIEVSGLEQARERPTFADFLDALAGGDRAAPLEVTAVEQTNGRVRLTVARSPGAGGGVGDYLAELAPEITGRVVSVRADAYVMSTARKDELARRLVPGIPADLQLLYVAGLVAGLLGAAVAWRWWTRLWPPEQPTDYASSVGYQLARGARLALFLLLFLPLAGVPAALWQIARQAWEVMTLTARFFSNLTQRRSESQPG